MDDRLEDAERLARAERGPVPDGDVIDAVQFDSLRRLADAGGDPTFLPTLVAHYLDQAEIDLSELRDAAAQEDAQGLIRAAHRLKGSSATMGAARLASVCEEMEQAAGRGVQPAPAEVDAVAAALEQTAAALLALAPGPGT